MNGHGGAFGGVKLRIKVNIGPVPARSAALWIESAEETLRILRTDRIVDVPWDVLVAFEGYLVEWRAHLRSNPETFHWSAEADDAVVRRIGLHWARMVSVVRSGRPSGLAAAPPEAGAFYDAVALGIADGLAAAGDAEFAGAFADAIPDFAAVAPELDERRDVARVLIVDHDEDARLLLRVWLERNASFDIVGEACDGHRAIELARFTKPDVALLDVNLPDMSGFDALGLIQTAAPDCAVIVMSTVDQHVAAVSSGAAAFLAKSTPVDKVLDVVRDTAFGARR